MYVDLYLIKLNFDTIENYRIDIDNKLYVPVEVVFNTIRAFRSLQILIELIK